MAAAHLEGETLTFPPVRWDWMLADIKSLGGPSYRQQAIELGVGWSTHQGWRAGAEPGDVRIIAGILAMHTKYCGDTATKMRCPYLVVLPDGATIPDRRKPYVMPEK